VWNVTNAATEITQGNSSRVMNKRAVRSAEATMMAAGPIIQGNRPGGRGVRGKCWPAESSALSLN
jgi:hypothetical protein